MVFQQFNLFPHLTALQNCALAPVWAEGVKRREAEERAHALLAKVRISDQAHKYPSQLSGGQQQRVAIARALCMNPKIMLFDEPTSALDPEMVKEVLDTMTALASEGMTMIVVTHELGFARRVADKVVLMDNGEIVEASDPEEFFTAPKQERARQFLSQLLHWRRRGVLRCWHVSRDPQSRRLHGDKNHPSRTSSRARGGAAGRRAWTGGRARRREPRIALGAQGAVATSISVLG